MESDRYRTNTRNIKQKLPRGRGINTCCYCECGCRMAIISVSHEHEKHASSQSGGNRLSKNYSFSPSICFVYETRFL